MGRLFVFVEAQQDALELSQQELSVIFLDVVFGTQPQRNLAVRAVIGSPRPNHDRNLSRPRVGLQFREHVAPVGVWKLQIQTMTSGCCSMATATVVAPLVA